jgi:hypothetical protein
MQMVQNKQVGAGLALIAAVLGMSVGGSAMALPEMDVGSVPNIVAPQPVNTLDSTVAAPDDEDGQDTAS